MLVLLLNSESLGGAFRFFRHFILLFAVHLSSISMFRFLASVFRTIATSMLAGSYAVFAVLLFSGFIITQRKLYTYRYKLAALCVFVWAFNVIKLKRGT